ncbi:MAG: copper resistance protein CopC [Pseudomonadota bacterium]
MSRSFSLFGRVIVAMLVISSTATAHTKMSTSVPAQGSSVRTGLETIQLGFAKPVRVMVVKVKRTDQADDIPLVSQGKSAFATSYDVKTTPLGAGTYDVNWTAIAKDGHVMKGTLSFTVTP